MESREEIVLVRGHELLLMDQVLDSLTAVDDDIELFVGAVTDSLQECIARRFRTPRRSSRGWAGYMVSTIRRTGWLWRLLLVDRSTVLASRTVSGTKAEQVIFGEGLGNGLVVMARRLITQWLVDIRDPRL